MRKKSFWRNSFCTYVLAPIFLPLLFVLGSCGIAGIITIVYAGLVSIHTHNFKAVADASLIPIWFIVWYYFVGLLMKLDWDAIDEITNLKKQIERLKKEKHKRGDRK